MTIRVAAIGVTHWHSLWDNAYLPQLVPMDDVEIAALHDEDASIASHRVNELGGQIAIYTDYITMLEEEKPDFVIALGRHDQMAGIAHELLDRRVPFMMEKPMSHNTRQLRGVLEKAEATGSFAGVPLFWRHSPFIEHAKRLKDEGTYGPMCQFYARQNRPTSARYARWQAPWMMDPQIASGGCLRNLGPHSLDSFAYLTGEGEDIEVTGAQLSWSTYGEQVEDYATVLLRSGSGIIGTIEVGNGFPRDGTDGNWKVGFRDAILTLQDEEVRLETAEGLTVLPHPAGRPFDVLRDTLEAARDGGAPPVSVRECYHAVRLIDLGYIAAGNPYGTAAV